MQSDRQIVVRDFCEKEFRAWDKAGRRFVDWCELDDSAKSYKDALIASLELLDISTGVGFDCVEIQRPPQDIPQKVSDTFERHFWYSQHSLSDLYLLKVLVNDQTAFVLLIRGLLDDGWDNSGRWIEVLDEQGEFLGAGRFGTKNISWQEVPLNGDSFNAPSPPWINDEVELGVSRPTWADEVNPMWSEEILTQYAVSIKKDGAGIRYVMSGD
jgi:hypothetical protein